jgi:tRNA (adenine37-N6)-methyltransferase
MGSGNGSGCREERFVVQPIGIIHSCFREKFGIPRQAGIAPAATAQLELFPPYNRAENVRGLEQFSHLWIHFLFHQTLAEGWKGTVRPPSLGGRRKVGIFASRSPHRPNHLGLSAVRLERVALQRRSCVLHLSGVDILAGSPVVDIKPYIPYCDTIATATSGYARGDRAEVAIAFTERATTFCIDYRERTGRDLQQLIVELILHDPRPASQRGLRDHFGMRLWEVNIRWRVAAREVVVVEECAVAPLVAEGAGSGERQVEAEGNIVRD